MYTTDFFLLVWKSIFISWILPLIEIISFHINNIVGWSFCNVCVPTNYLLTLGSKVDVYCIIYERYMYSAWKMHIIMQANCMISAYINHENCMKIAWKVHAILFHDLNPWVSVLFICILILFYSCQSQTFVCLLNWCEHWSMTLVYTVLTIMQQTDYTTDYILSKSKLKFDQHMVALWNSAS